MIGLWFIVELPSAVGFRDFDRFKVSLYFFLFRGDAPGETELKAIHFY